MRWKSEYLCCAGRWGPRRKGWRSGYTSCRRSGRLGVRSPRTTRPPRYCCVHLVAGGLVPVPVNLVLGVHFVRSIVSSLGRGEAGFVLDDRRWRSWGPRCDFPRVSRGAELLLVHPVLSHPRCLPPPRFVVPRANTPTSNVKRRLKPLVVSRR